MFVKIYVDSCAWNFLFNKKIDLKLELPPDRYKLYITHEVEIELSKIPDIGKDGSDKRKLKHYITESIKQSHITTTGTFGFATLEPDGTLTEVQTYAGFNQGTFQSKQEHDYYNSPEVKKLISSKPTVGSGLSANQADASLAVHANTAIVLTDERVNKPGPLKLAANKGAKIVYLSDQVVPSGLSLGDYIASTTNAAACLFP